MTNKELCGLTKYLFESWNRGADYDNYYMDCQYVLEALAQPEQGPVLTTKMREELNSRLSDHWYGCADEVWRIILAAGTAQPAAQYPTPPKEPQGCDKRTWVDLTGKEKELIASVSLDVHDAVHRTNAKLKELNK